MKHSEDLKKKTEQIDFMEEVKGDFRKFLFLVWKHLNLPDPTPLQYDIASFLQHGPTKILIEAFRGCGKSYITSAYVIWELLRNPQLNIMVVSASKQRADDFTTFTLGLIYDMPILHHLKPRADQRNSKIAFDVGPKLRDHSPSVVSKGITSQLAGSRADIIVFDDVEVPGNSMTADQREKLAERVKEGSAILKPLPTAKQVYLGTPQCEDSLYNKLPETFTGRVWPAYVPTEEEAETYGGSLAPFIQKMIMDGKEGEPVDPLRFTMFDLEARRAEYGKAGFSLQFMLNTQLSDMERFPLKVRDLIVCDTMVSEGPMSYRWMPHDDREHSQLPNLAMAGDKFYAPVNEERLVFREYEGSVLAIDPAGRGKDETGYSVVKSLNGYLTVRRCGGLQGGYDDETLTELAKIAAEEEVNLVYIESNFGDGMFTQLFTPVLLKHHRCQIEEVRHSTQKEARIIDTLEPVMARHKLIFDRSIIENDYRSIQKYDSSVRLSKSLIYQMTRVCYDRGALKHDDRLDALALGVSWFTDMMARDKEAGIEKDKQAKLDEELKRYMRHAIGLPKGNSKWASR